MNSTVRQPSSAPTIKDRVITQAIAVVFFVMVPTVITLMAPLSNIEFQYFDSGATVTVHRYVLMFIPWKTERITQVKRIRADITPEKHYRGTSEERRKGQTGVRVATGQVAIIGDGPEVIVQAAPDLAKSVVEQFDQFIANQPAEPITIAVYASWSLSYILGGIVTSLCALYVVGATLTVLLFPFKLIRSRAA